jgi:hypothetical protein
MGEEGYQVPDLSLVGPEHVRRYQETDGEVGYVWNGVPTLLLTVTGRRSGEPPTNALIFGRDGDDYLVVASMGGAPRHPAGTSTSWPTHAPNSRCEQSEST